MKDFPLLSAFLIFLLIPLLCFSPEVTEGARQGLLLWYDSVVPALFPFMVLSGLIVASGGIDSIMAPFYMILHPFLGISREGCYVLISGLLCGYPMGAKTCAEFVSDGKITVCEGRFLMTICNHPSPMFLLGYVYPWFSSKIDIGEILIPVYAPIILLAFVAKFIYPFNTDRINEFATDLHKSDPTTNHVHGTDEAILSSIEVLCKIGGYLVIFSIIIVMIRKNTILPDMIKLGFIGLLEMTTGIREYGELEHWQFGYTASIAALTFGGLSGIFQTKSVLNQKKAGLSIRPYIFWKSAHAIISVGIAYLLLCNRN